MRVITASGTKIVPNVKATPRDLADSELIRLINNGRTSVAIAFREAVTESDRIMEGRWSSFSQSIDD